VLQGRGQASWHTEFAARFEEPPAVVRQAAATPRQPHGLAMLVFRPSLVFVLVQGHQLLVEEQDEGQDLRNSVAIILPHQLVEEEAELAPTKHGLKRSPQLGGRSLTRKRWRNSPLAHGEEHVKE